MNTMVIEITAQDGSKKEYSIQMKLLNSGCEITAVSPAVGKIQGPHVYNISSKTTVRMLLEALTLSKCATIKVVDESNQVVSEDSKVEDTMKIVVTAENGVDKKEYTIKTFIAIDTIEDLRNINGSDSQGKTYKLMKSLDFNSDDSYEDISNKTQADIANWNPINYFKGTFEGNGNKISHLTITGDEVAFRSKYSKTSDAFAGITDKTEWTFTTELDPTKVISTEYTVDDDNSFISSGSEDIFRGIILKTTQLFIWDSFKSKE